MDGQSVLGQRHATTFPEAPMSGINHSERARLAWQELVLAAKNRTTLTYGALGALIGVHHRAIGYVLSPIQDYCLEARLPPLTILVINSSGLPGTGFIAHDRADLEGGLRAVWQHDWTDERNPFDFAAQGLSFNELVATLATHPDDAEHVYTRVKNRGVAQLLFKAALLKAYATRCAFTGMAFVEVLEGCHVVPWAAATPQQRLDVRNGLLLNAMHHKMLDKGLITITVDGVIQFRDPAQKVRQHSSMEKALTADLHGQMMRQPRLLKHRPLAKNIEQHHAMLDWNL